jgi:hypothetical protein
MFALSAAAQTNLYLADLAAEAMWLDELAILAEEKGAIQWRVLENCMRGGLLTMTGNPNDAVQMLTRSITSLQSAGERPWALLGMPWLALAYAQLKKPNEAWDCISGALALIKESNLRIIEAEVHRVAGEITLLSPKRDVVKAEDCFACGLAVARQQQAKSWELRAAMSLARLWRDQGKMREARELLAPVYGWFTEGFDTHDLKEAKRLLDELAAWAQLEIRSMFPQEAG